MLTTALGTEAFAVEFIVWCRAEEKYAFVSSVREAKPRLVYHSLTEMVESLGEYAQFVRCHRSRLVNMTYCNGWQHSGKEAIVRMVHGNTSEDIRVSRTYKADFVRRWKRIRAEAVMPCAAVRVENAAVHNSEGGSFLLAAVRSVGLVRAVGMAYFCGVYKTTPARHNISAHVVGRCVRINCKTDSRRKYNLL